MKLCIMLTSAPIRTFASLYIFFHISTVDKSDKFSDFVCGCWSVWTISCCFSQVSEVQMSPGRLPCSCLPTEDIHRVLLTHHLSPCPSSSWLSSLFVSSICANPPADMYPVCCKFIINYSYCDQLIDSPLLRNIDSLISSNHASCNPVSCNPASCNPASCNPVSCHPASCNPTSSNYASCNPASCNPTPSNHASCNPASCNPTSSNHASCNPTSCHPASCNLVSNIEHTSNCYIL